MSWLRKFLVRPPFLNLISTSRLMNSLIETKFALECHRRGASLEKRFRQIQTRAGKVCIHFYVLFTYRHSKTHLSKSAPSPLSKPSSLLSSSPKPIVSSSTLYNQSSARRGRSSTVSSAPNERPKPNQQQQLAIRQLRQRRRHRCSTTRDTRMGIRMHIPVRGGLG